MFFLLNFIIFLRPFFSEVKLLWPSIFFSIILLSILSIYIYIKVTKDRVYLNKDLIFAVSLFVIFLGTSLFFSKEFTISISRLHNYIIYFLAFFTGIIFDTKEKRQILNTFIICVFIVSILAIIHYFLDINLLLSSLTKKYIWTKRASLPLVTPNALAGFLILGIPFILEKKNYFILTLVLTALILTKSLGAFISLFSGLILYFYIKDREKIFKNVGLILIVIFLILFTFFIRQMGSEIKVSLSIYRRLNYWKETIDLIKKHPFIGSGLGNFKLSHTFYSHNLLLQILAEMGMVGLVSFLYFITVCFKYIFLNIKNSQNKILYLQIFVSVFIFLAHNLIDFTFYLPEISFFWWMILGIGLK